MLVKLLLLVASACGNNNRYPYGAYGQYGAYGNYGQYGVPHNSGQVLTYETPERYDNSKNKESIQTDPLKSKTYTLSDRDNGFDGVEVDFRFNENGQLNLNMRINASYVGENNNTLTYVASNVPYSYDEEDKTISFDGRIRASRKTRSHTGIVGGNNVPPYHYDQRYNRRYADPYYQRGLHRNIYHTNAYRGQRYPHHHTARNYGYDPIRDRMVNPHINPALSYHQPHLQNFAQVQRLNPISSITLELSDIPIKGTSRKSYAELDNDNITFEENLVLRAWELVPHPTNDLRNGGHSRNQVLNNVTSWGAKPRSMTTKEHPQSAGLQFDDPELISQ